MATTNFVDGTTVIQASWLNDVDAAVYSKLPAILTPEYFGATGSGDDTTAFQAAIDALPTSGGVILGSAENYTISGTLSAGNKAIVWMNFRKINSIINSDKLPGMAMQAVGNSAPYTQFAKNQTSQTDYTGFNFYRNANYTGTSSSVTNLVRLETDVASTVGTATRKPEWVLTAVINNNSDNCNAVAVTGQANKSANGPVWSAQFNTYDTYTGGSFYARAIEANIQATGADTNGRRSVIDAIAHSPNGTIYDPTSFVKYGVRAYAHTGNYTYAFSVETAGSGTIDTGFDTSSVTFTSNDAIKIRESQGINWNANNATRISTEFNVGTGYLNFSNAGVPKVSVLVGASTGRLILNNGPQWISGAGSPEGVVTAPVGSFYSRTNGGAGTSFYVKESGVGNTGWVAK